MRALARFLPIIVGLLLGYVLVSPPSWLSVLGGWRWLGAVALALAGLVAMTGYQLWVNLPADPTLEPAAEERVDGEIRELSQRFEALGFDRVGPPLVVGLAPPALMVVLVNERECTYATVFRTSTVPPKTAFDCVSMLEGDRGGLTTGAERGGAATPAARGSLRQVIAGAGVEQVFRAHRDALAYLRGRGLRARQVSASTFRRDFAMSFARQREAFTSAPVRGTLVTLWRASTGRTPHLGPITRQAVARATIAELQAGARG